MTEVLVQAPEPRYVAPTRRDRIGRIWAPVYINDQGPFRLVLDSGATRTGVIASVANSLGLTQDTTRSVLLRGVTGSATVPTIRVKRINIGDLDIGTSELPILADALGGADGVLGTDGLADRRVFIDFQHDMITIMRSHGQRAAPGFLTIPFELLHGKLLTVSAHVGNVAVTAIIDTGGQVTIANRALQQALESRRKQMKFVPDQITGVTLDVQEGEDAGTPPLRIDARDGKEMEIQSSRVTFADTVLFDHWHLNSEPAMLIGMDALGLLDTLVIDYRRQELQVRMRGS